MAEPSEQISGDQYEEKLDSQPFRKPASAVDDWISSLKNADALEDSDVSGNLEAPGTIGKDYKDMDSSQQSQLFPSLTDHQQFIQQSRAYQWLLSMIKGCAQLDISNRSLMFDIGESIRKQLLAYAPFRKVSRHRASASIEMSFSLDWKPPSVYPRNKNTLSPPRKSWIILFA